MNSHLICQDVKYWQTILNLLTFLTFVNQTMMIILESKKCPICLTISIEHYKESRPYNFSCLYENAVSLMSNTYCSIMPFLYIIWQQWRGVFIKEIIRLYILESTSNAKDIIETYIIETHTTELRKLRHNIFDIFRIES